MSNEGQPPGVHPEVVYSEDRLQQGIKTFEADLADRVSGVSVPPASTDEPRQAYPPLPQEVADPIIFPSIEPVQTGSIQGNERETERERAPRELDEELDKFGDFINDDETRLKEVNEALESRTHPQTSFLQQYTEETAEHILRYRAVKWLSNISNLILDLGLTPDSKIVTEGLRSTLTYDEFRDLTHYVTLGWQLLPPDYRDSNLTKQWSQFEEKVSKGKNWAKPETVPTPPPSASVVSEEERERRMERAREIPNELRKLAEVDPKRGGLISEALGLLDSLGFRPADPEAKNIMDRLNGPEFDDFTKNWGARIKAKLGGS